MERTTSGQLPLIAMGQKEKRREKRRADTAASAAENTPANTKFDDGQRAPLLRRHAKQVGGSIVISSHARSGTMEGAPMVVRRRSLWK
jgi:hypothetical protein